MSNPVGVTVGPSHVLDGSNPDFRTGKDRQVITDGLHGPQYEAVSRGNMFSVMISASGVAPGTGFSTTSPMQLWNPPNSGVNAIIREVSVGYISGTIGAGVIGYGINPSQVTKPTTGTALTIIQLNGSTSKNSVISASTGSTASAASTLVKLGPSLVGTLATAAAAAVGVYFPPSKDSIEGGILVTPGTLFSVESYFAAAGSTPLVAIGVTWEEVGSISN